MEEGKRERAGEGGKSENAPALQCFNTIAHLRLSRHSPTLQLLQRIRDEAHRFAITYHRKLREKNFLDSRLLEIEGVGPARQKALLRYFGSLARIEEASQDQLAEVPGLDSRVAQRIFQFFHPKEENGKRFI
jgi:excinuclease ABC subunit C